MPDLDVRWEVTSAQLFVTAIVGQRVISAQGVLLSGFTPIALQSGNVASGQIGGGHLASGELYPFMVWSGHGPLRSLISLNNGPHTHIVSGVGGHVAGLVTSGGNLGAAMGWEVNALVNDDLTTGVFVSGIWVSVTARGGSSGRYRIAGAPPQAPGQNRAAVTQWLLVLSGFVQAGASGDGQLQGQLTSGGAGPNSFALGSAVQGTLAIYNPASGWVPLGPGASGKVLTSKGSGFDPVWA